MTDVLHRSAQAGETGYLLRAGTDVRFGVCEEILGRFVEEEDARQAFLAVRLSPAYRDGWAELLGVSDGRTPRPLCWFGARSSLIELRQERQAQGGAEANPTQKNEFGAAIRPRARVRVTSRKVGTASKWLS